MLELSIIHRPGIINGKQNLGRILEAMLYYDRVHLMMSAQMFVGLWDILGADDMKALLGHPSVTTTLTPEMLAIKNQTAGSVTTHRPIAIKLAGREGKLIHDKDDVGTLRQLIENRADCPSATRAQVAEVVKLTKTSRYAKILGGEAESRDRFASLIKDPETLKLFVRGWAIAHRQTVDELPLRQARIDVIEIGEEFMVSSTVPIESMVSGWNPTETWGSILGNAQDYAVDLHLSNAFGGDIITAREIAEIAAARVDLSLQRARRSGDQISAFEEMVFEEAHPFAAAINDGLISFAEALHVIDKSQRFRTWTRGLPPDASIITEYHRAVTKETILKSLPASVVRFAMFNGAGLVLDAVSPGAGVVVSAFDTFVVDRLASGWRPNVFVRNVQRALDRAHQRSAQD